MVTKGRGRQELVDALGLREDRTMTAIRHLIRRNILFEDGDFIDINPDNLSWRTEGNKKGRRFSKDGWQLAQYLADSIEVWKSGYIVWKNKHQKFWQSAWALDMDKLLATGLTVNEIQHVIDGFGRDKDQEHKGPNGFSWRKNILSASKLSEKWDKLSVRYGPKSNKVKREKRYYDDPQPEDYNQKDWKWQGENIDKVF
jgi:hypothetical protein